MHVEPGPHPCRNDDAMKHSSTPDESVGVMENAAYDCSVSISSHRTPDEQATPIPTPSSNLSFIETALPPAQVIDRLARESKRGRLAGFRSLGERSAAVTAFGGIYDYELIISPQSAGASGSRVEFELRLLRKMPAIAIALFVVSIFPGLQLTHSMLSIYFSWYTIQTWWWYLPLVLLSAPLMWKQFRGSQAEARRDAEATIEKLRPLLAAK